LAGCSSGAMKPMLSSFAEEASKIPRTRDLATIEL
jgi:hypothetical protein